MQRIGLRVLFSRCSPVVCQPTREEWGRVSRSNSLIFPLPDIPLSLHRCQLYNNHIPQLWSSLLVCNVQKPSDIKIFEIIRICNYRKGLRSKKKSPVQQGTLKFHDVAGSEPRAHSFDSETKCRWSVLYHKPANTNKRSQLDASGHVFRKA